MKVVLSLTWSSQWRPYPARATDQPSLRAALLPPIGGGDIKQSWLHPGLSANCGGLVIQHCGRKHKKLYKMNICTWNVRTLQDNGNQLERRTAIIGRELARYDTTIAALCETRLLGESQLIEKGAGYTFFGIGKPDNEPRQAGVGFTVKSTHI